MATPLRVTIYRLHQQLSRLKIVGLTRPGIKCPLAVTIPERTKYSWRKKRSCWQKNRRTSVIDDDQYAVDDENPELEEAEDFVLQHDLGIDLTNNDTSHSSKERQRIKMAIIRKKYFKPEQETSLLTWEAQEQIRFLYKSMPDIWTVTKLARSYPCSENGIRKILHSSYRPLSEAEKDRYNRRTRDNWLALQAFLSNKGSLVSASVLQLLEENKLPLMVNAGGIKDVHAVKQGRSKRGKAKGQSEHVGLFESIIKSYRDKIPLKDGQSRACQNSEKSSAEHCTEQLLLGIAQMDKTKRFPALTGSTEPGKIALTVGGRDSIESDSAVHSGKHKTKSEKQLQTHNFKYKYGKLS